jgi:hypothetical protein
VSAIAVELTRITKDCGAVTKRLHLTPDGLIVNDSSRCAIGAGRMTRTILPDWRAFAEMIEKTPRNTAYVLGALRPDLPDSVLLVRKRDPQSAQPGFATRTAGEILYKAVPSFVLCDFDAKGMPEDIRSRHGEFDDFLGALETVCPRVATAGSVSRRSTSANLVNAATGETYPSNGEHLYLLVQDGTDAHRFLYALHNRCWLAGLGWYIVGEAGQLLERSIIDRMVCAPERLVFEASPDLDPPLRQEKREATRHDGAPLDTRAACADLNAGEQAELATRKAEAARLLGKEIEVARETFVAGKVKEAVARGMTPAAARLMAEQWGKSILLPGVVLEFDELGAIPVADILADPGRFDGETLADPIEGIGYGRNCAIVQVRAGIPSIFSFAHGGAIYKLRHDFESVKAAILAASGGEAAHVYSRMVFAADLDPVEKKLLAKLAAKRSGAGVRDVEAAARLAKPKAEINGPAAPLKPVIRIAPGEIPRIVDEIEEAVLAAERGLYKRGGQIVRIGEIELLGVDEKKTTALAIIAQNEHALLEDVSASAQFMKFIKRENEWLPIDPPASAVLAWQARASRLRLPLLSAVISTPLILPTGRIIEKPGYDEGTGFFFNPLGAAFPPIPNKPTREDARVALNLLVGLIKEFPFIDEASKAVALSGILTSVARRAIDFAFMHAITAPAFGSGKSYLVDLFCMIATGRPAPAVDQNRSQEEFEKGLNAHLLKGVSHMAIDNVSRPLGGSRLAQILTQTLVDVRPFGTLDNITVQPTTFITATGTNITVVKDLRRRTLLCSMDAKIERPELRRFSEDPLKAVGADRGKYVAAALTIIRAFMLTGGKQAEPINNYARYCAMIRDPLIWLGCADPCVTLETIREQDPTLGIRKQIARQWRDVLGNEPKTARQVIDEASRRNDYDNELTHPDFFEALSEVAKDGKTLNPNKLGYWLRGIKNDVFSLTIADPLNSSVTRPVAHWFAGRVKNEVSCWELNWEKAGLAV